MSQVSLDTIAALCKRRGFIYQGSEIYGGLAGTWDYGPLGVQLKRNLTDLWWQMFVLERSDMFGIESTILMNPKVWRASGHEQTFHDPLIEDVKTKKRYRLDHLLADNGVSEVDTLSLEQMSQLIKDKHIKSPEGNQLGSPAYFNMMFKTNVGPVESEESKTYLRPETAQGMFSNFKNVVDSFQPDIPFGLAQIGRSFRNEISPGNFIFRVRELEIMELEYFIKPDKWQDYFNEWRMLQQTWFKRLGLDETKLKEHEVPEADRAHYSQRTIDFYYDFPSIGWQEISGLAYRSDFDLKNHQTESGKNLEYRPKDGTAAFIPHVIEPTFGVERHVMAVLANAYSVDEPNGEPRTFLKLLPHLAPVKVAVFPLLKNKPELIDKARSIFAKLKPTLLNVMWDDNGNIGKRYRRQDEIGTPFCVTVDFDSLNDDTVTVRSRDTTEQQRLKTDELDKFLISQF